MRSLFSLAALCAALSSVPLSAEELAETAARFGVRQSVTDVAISPSGGKILYVAPGDTTDETVYLVNLNGDAAPKAVITTNEAKARLDGCSWANEARFVCTVYGSEKVGSRIIYVTRAFSVSEDGSDVVSLTPPTHDNYGILQDGGRFVAIDVAGEPDGVLMTRQYIKQDSRNTRLFNDREGLGVDLVDIRRGTTKSVEKPNTQADDYIADEKGRVRLMAVSDRSRQYDGNDRRYLYRPLDSDEWLPLSEVDLTGDLAQGFVPVAVDSRKNVAYGFERLNGFKALYSIALDGSARKELVRSRNDADVDQLVQIGRGGRVIGVSYATDRRYVEYFDPAYEKLADGLRNALPGQPQISILDANADESTIVLAASSDNDPGTIYLYERETNALGELLPLREPLVGREMGKMDAITYAASDGTEIPGYLTLPPGSSGSNLPAVVIPHGGPGSRDEWGFDWLVQFFAARGYAVLQPNFRGSAGYGEAWFGRNGYKDWDKAVGDVAAAGRWLIDQGIAAPEQLSIVGWSYGGYAALQSQVMAPDLYQAVVAIAPVADLELLREENRQYSSFLAVDRMIGNGPHIEAGSPARHAAEFDAPVLLVHGTMDLNVGVAHSKLMNDRLKSAGKSVEYLEFEGLDHGLVHSQARRIMLKRIGEFLERSTAN